jgi:hypothetical protein
VACADTIKIAHCRFPEKRALFFRRLQTKKTLNRGAALKRPGCRRPQAACVRRRPSLCTAPGTSGNPAASRTRSPAAACAARPAAHSIAASQVWILIVALDQLLAVPRSCWTSDGPEAFQAGSMLPKALEGRGAPEHAGEAALAEGVATRHQHARHNPLAAPHRQSDRAAAGGLGGSKTTTWYYLTIVFKIAPRVHVLNILVSPNLSDGRADP